MDAEQLQFSVKVSGQRLDKVIMSHVGNRFSRAQVQAFIKEGLVTVDGKAVKAGIKLKGGEQITITMPPRDESRAVQPEAIPLTVLYEDDDLAVIDKPAGMVVHPGVGDEASTLVSAILARWPQIAEMNIEPKRAGIVHRLDKGTSGLIIIAKHDRARRQLAEQFQARTVEKSYLTLLERTPPTTTGRIEAPIARDPNQRKRMAVLRGGKPAISEYEVIDRDFLDDRVLVRVRLLTGRTHQIRVHMAFIGCPIVGDAVYGFRKQRIKMKRQFLHAARLCFDQPTTGERLCFDSPLPAGLQNILEKLRPV
ncbi:MAG: RluA family pseudouridine synthase [Anaerolineaceae bacterium]|nr:RluA family pseudouridine synthase [Anaerolineaceae bacterium]